MTALDLVLLTQLFSAGFMTGLIWYVQLVHYPLLAAVGESAFPTYHQQHVRRTTWIVAPVMLSEALGAIGLALLAPAALSTTANLALALLLFVWLSTVALQVPLHHQLERGRRDAVAALVRTNWLRVAAWSARLALLMIMLAQTSRIA